MFIINLLTYLLIYFLTFLLTYLLIIIIIIIIIILLTQEKNQNGQSALVRNKNKIKMHDIMHLETGTLICRQQRSNIIYGHVQNAVNRRIILAYSTYKWLSFSFALSELCDTHLRVQHASPFHGLETTVSLRSCAQCYGKPHLSNNLPLVFWLSHRYQIILPSDRDIMGWKQLA